MHPEVTKDGPGRCTKCGMALVPEAEAALSDASHEHDARESYTPLVVVLLLILAATVVLGVVDAAAGRFALAKAVSNFMAGFFIVFAGFKLMDLRGFAEGYSTYDLLARRLPAYGFVYPFVELGFGLSMLASYEPMWLLWAEVAVMAFSGLGVAIKLARHEKFQCACLGTFLKVPLTKVTLVEDFGMAALAGLLIWLRWMPGSG